MANLVVDGRKQVESLLLLKQEVLVLCGWCGGRSKLGREVRADGVEPHHGFLQCRATVLDLHGPLQWRTLEQLHSCEPKPRLFGGS